MYVRCIAGCQSLFAEERVTLPRISEGDLGLSTMDDERGTFRNGEGVPFEGDAAEDNSLPF